MITTANNAITFLLLGFLLNIPLLAQQATPKLNPKFDPFEGIVYRMPEIEHYVGKLKRNDIQEFYSDAIYSYDSIGLIRFKEINIPNSSTETELFPGVEYNTHIAMLLHSKMEIEHEGCYSFTLNSDDGSRLWINGKQVVNNDGGHQMKSKSDTILLRPNNYDIKLWYFQGKPYQFGFIFDGKLLDKTVKCKAINFDTALDVKQSKAKKVILGPLLFDVASADVSELGINEIVKIAKQIDQRNSTEVTVIGHTDSTGENDFNDKLSEQRALSVITELKKHILNKSTKFIAIGKGSTKPINSSKTAEAMSQNRRVELIMN